MTLEMRLRDERRVAMKVGEERGIKLGRKEGRQEGRKEGVIDSIKNLMTNMNIDAIKAMELLGIAKEEQQVYLPLLQ